MELNERNLNLFTDFFTGNTAEVDNKDDDYKNLFLTYASDNNSSTVREAVTLHYLGYTSRKEKHGADGIAPNTGQEVEVKPKYVTKGKKLSSAVGNFNDMTLELLEKKKNYSVIGSLFSDTRLIYVVEFPISLIYEKMKQHIIKKIEGKAGKRVVCSFSYKQYDSDLLTVHYFDEKTSKEIKILSKPHTKMLTKRKNDKTK